MLAKNNKQEQLRQSAMKDKRFGLKKLSVGLASVALGTILFLGQANAVSAAELGEDVEVYSQSSENIDVYAEENLGDDYYAGNEEEADLTVQELLEAKEFKNMEEYIEENLDDDYYVGQEDVADATAEDFAGLFENKEYGEKTKEYINNELNLTDEQKKFYKGVIDQLEASENYQDKTSEVTELAIVNSLINRAKNNAEKRYQSIKQAESKLNILSYDVKDLTSYQQILKTKKEELVTELSNLKEEIKVRETYIAKSKEYISTLSVKQKEFYEEVIDNVTSLDSYQKQIDEVTELALVESLVNRAKMNANKRDRSIKQAESRLQNISYEGQNLATYQQKLRDKKAELATELVIVKKKNDHDTKVQTYKKQQIDYITAGKDPDLNAKQIEFYSALINSVTSGDNYEQQIEEILNLRQAEKLIEKAKKTKTIRAKRLLSAELILNNTVNESLLSKKKELLDVISTLKTENTDSNVKSSKSNIKETFESRQKEVQEVLVQMYAELKIDSMGKKYATEKYNNLFIKFQQLVSKWEEAARTEMQKTQVQGVKDLVKNHLI